MHFERYAIYWAPRPETGLAEFGRRWLGGDAETGAAWPDRERLGLDADLLERATASPRRYALHATMKAPFRLAEGRSETELAAALEAFCARRRRVLAGPLRLNSFSRYLALTLESGRAEVDWLADECVTHFDPFRAALSEADRARRPKDLPPLQARHLAEFGYPHIFSDFVFHVTLAGPLEPDELGRVQDALAPAVAPLTGPRFAIEDLCLFGDPGEGGLFKLVGRFPLKR
ncbi:MULTISPECIES: DUF1045 domain-containing protein [Rhodomicrobium]|uniref:DUF1045 domain-containing protein n=1 Tax=Rhodomicrobium TaxID=1068 RepID=UPI000B4AAAE5|nr:MULTISPECIES: DUF1045 domain-containing protein [Rhodomicrobium]